MAMGNSEVLIVTGGAGYIGSHTIVELVKATDLRIISVDDHSNSSPRTFERLERITGRKIPNHVTDLKDSAAVKEIMRGYGRIAGVIHFAAYKSVPHSMRDPYTYYHNNINSLLNLLEACIECRVPSFIFSSSCSVYGDIPTSPVDEDTPLGRAGSPYAHTKQVGERILEEYARTHAWLKAMSLRYFNPVGAHPSALIGDDPREPPSSLVPMITRKAAGRQRSLVVHGTDYATRDGSCIRDLVHVVDIARAHVMALGYTMRSEPGNTVIGLGTGRGVTVLETIAAFERITGISLGAEMGPRREGDVAAIFADPTRAREMLGWIPAYGLEEMLISAWKWEQQQMRAPED